MRVIDVGQADQVAYLVQDYVLHTLLPAWLLEGCCKFGGVELDHPGDVDAGVVAPPVPDGPSQAGYVHSEVRLLVGGLPHEQHGCPPIPVAVRLVRGPLPGG